MRKSKMRKDRARTRGAKRRQAVRRVSRLKDNKAEKPRIELVNGVSFTEVHCALQEFVSSPYCGDILDLALACLINASRTGDAVIWLLIVGVPSGGKTETILGVKHEPSVYYLDKLTDHAFISGFVREDGSSPTDLLAELNGKCLVVKDLSPLFSARREVTKAIIGDMVSIYDGSFSAKFGTKEKVSYEARFSFVACITPKAIQNHQTYMQELGSRPLFYRVPSLDQEEKEEGMDMILRNGKRMERITHYGRLCSSYAHSLLESNFPVVNLTQEQGEALKKMADLLARGRAVAVTSHSEGGSGKDFQIEEPFRILSQLRAFANALTLVHGREAITDHEMELVRRMVLSTIPLNRASVLALFRNKANLTPEGGLTVKLCAKGTELSPTGAENLLKDLISLGILQLDSSQMEHRYRLSPEFADLLEKHIEPLDHVADLASVEGSPTQLLVGENTSSPTELTIGRGEVRYDSR